MDFSTFYQQGYPNLTAVNLHANNAYALNNNPSQQPHRESQQQQQQANVPLQQNLFYLDPFETEVDANEMDHASFSNDSDQFLDDIDDISRSGNVAQDKRSLSQSRTNSARKNPSPQGMQTVNRLSQDFDVLDLANQDNSESANGGNSSKRKAQNRAAQRAFRERKERHVKDLEAKVAELEQMTQKMTEENSRLIGRVSKLESENTMLKGSNVTFTFPQFEPKSTAQQNGGNYSPPLSDHGTFTECVPPVSVLQPDTTMFDFDHYNLSPLPPQKTTSSPSTESGLQTPISTRVQNLMQQYHDYNSTKSNVPIPRAEDGHNLLDCPKVWEKIVNHPRFDEVEIDDLCAELNAKVKICVETGGPSVDGRDLEVALNEAIDTVAARS